MLLANVAKIFILLATMTAQASTICDADNIRLLQNQKNVFASSKELFASVGHRSNLHIFGDAHFYTDTNLLTRLINELNPQMPGSDKCMLLEHPKGGLARFSLALSNLLQKDLSPENRTKIESMANYYTSIVKAAALAGMKVIEIDHPDQLNGGRGEETVRNEFMAATAQQLLTDNTCDSAILVIGKAHIAPFKNHKSIVDVMREKGLQPITYNLADSAETTGKKNAVWGGMKCDPRTLFPAAFSNAILPADVSLWPFSSDERQALWTDFDYSISR